MKIPKLLILLCSLFLFTACSSDDNDSSSVSPSLSVENLLSLNLSFSAEADEIYVIAVKTNQSSWDVQSDKDWCIVVKTGDNEFTVIAQPNTSPQSPEPATITITAGDAQPVKIKATQSGLGAELSINPSSPIEFSAKDDKSVEITVTTNQAYWDAVADASWCVITKDNGKFTVSVQENTSKEGRNTNIIVSAPNTADIAILVEQKGAESGDGGGGGGNGGLEITLEDARKHRVRKTVSYQYEVKGIGPGAAGKGVTWDFSVIGIDLSKYGGIVESEGKALTYSTSPYKNYYPDATECYMTKDVRTFILSGTSYVIIHNDFYDYVDENKLYGVVQHGYTDGNSIVNIVNYYNPAITEPYPQYLGLKFTKETTQHSISIPGSPSSPKYYHTDIEIDGEGTVILPNGKKFTDVLRQKVEIADNNGVVQYHYISKQYGIVLDLVLNKEYSSIAFTDIIN